MLEGKYFWLKSELNGLCLDLSYGKAEPGNDVITWEYRGADNQLWFEDRANHVIRTKLDPKLVLEQRNDGRVMVNTFEPGKAEQQWKLGHHRVCRVGREVDCLNIIDGKQEHAAYLNVTEYHDKPEHKWEAKYLEAVPFFIMSQMHGKALDIEGANTSSGARVILWDFHGKINQQWYEDKHGEIRSKMHNMALKLAGDHVVMGDREVGHGDQAWMRSTESIFCQQEPHMCLEIAGGNRDNLATLTCAHNQHLDHQRWTFQNVA